MVATMKPLGGNRYRESYGRYFEEFEVGAIYEHRPGRTVTEADNTWFTLLTMNKHPLHFDTEYAAHSEFGKPLVNSCLTLIDRRWHDRRRYQPKSHRQSWAGTDIKLSAPVFAGDTLYAESEILAKRESKSRPTQGIVSVRTWGKKQDGTVFMSFDRSVLVPNQGHGVDDAAGY